MALASLHHVTCVCSDAQRTAAFYRDELGFSLVKKTVNFDDPHSYHLYFGDEDALAGSLLTFFEWPRADRGRLGRGTFESIGLVSPKVQTEWQLEDPDGLRLRVLPGRAARACTTWSRSATRCSTPACSTRSAPIAFAAPSEEVGADRRRHDAPHRLARRRRRRAGRLARPPARARPAPDRRPGPQVLPLDLLPPARRDPAGDRHGRPRLPRRRAGRDARHEPRAAAVARARARDARTRAGADRLTGR